MADNQFRVPTPQEIDEHSRRYTEIAGEVLQIIRPLVGKAQGLLEEAQNADDICIKRLKESRAYAEEAERRLQETGEQVRRLKADLENIRDAKEKLIRLIDHELKLHEEYILKKSSSETEQKENLQKAQECAARIQEYRRQHTELSMKENQDRVSLDLLEKEERKAAVLRDFYVGKYQKLLKAYTVFTAEYDPFRKEQEKGNIDKLLTKAQTAADETAYLGTKLDILSQALQQERWGPGGK